MGQRSSTSPKVRRRSNQNSRTVRVRRWYVPNDRSLRRLRYATPGPQPPKLLRITEQLLAESLALTILLTNLALFRRRRNSRRNVADDGPFVRSTGGGRHVE